MKKLIKNITVILILLIFCIVFTIKATAADEENTDNIYNKNIEYVSHIQNIGWEKTTKNGEETSGTTGQNLPIEAIKINLANMPEGVNISYQVHIRNIGWQDWVANGEEAGTTGMALPIEAIRIKLQNTSDYSIQYRAHVQNIGWQDWAIDGETAGTTGRALNVEAIEIRIIPKTVKAQVKIESVNKTVYENTLPISGWAMASTEDTTLEAYIGDTKLEGNFTYTERNDLNIIGYGGKEYNPTPGFNANLDISNISDGYQELTLKLLNKDGEVIASAKETITIDKSTVRATYVSHVKNIGWQDWVMDGETSGTTGQNLQVEAVKIKLMGDLPDGATITYQAHVKNTGWQKWVTNGTEAGTTGDNIRMEAIRIKLENMDDYSVEYRAHVKNIGWQDWVIDGEMAGTTGQGLQIEALEIRVIPKEIRAKMDIDTDLTENVIDDEEFTISGWAMSNEENTTIEAYVDGEKIEGTIKYYERADIIEQEIGYGGIENNPTPGFDLNLDTSELEDGTHELKIVLADKEGNELTSVTKEITVDKTTVGVKYQTYISGDDWQGWVRGSTQSNETGSKIGAIQIKLVGDLPEDAEITYQTHMSSIGWQDWTSNGEIAGVVNNSSRKLEAIRIKLNNVEDKYSIEYNAYVDGLGWQGWANDGEIAGTTGQNKGIQAIQIRIVDKITEVKARMYVDTPIMDGVSTVTVTNTTTLVKGWAMTNQDDTSIKIKIDGTDITESIERTERQDVLDKIKGYGGEEKNSNPGFEVNVDFSRYSIGTHTISVQVLSQDGTILCSTDRTLNIKANFSYSEGVYGYSGLVYRGSSQGTGLPYYKIGEGPNVLFATFAIHGWEDNWAGDGNVLIEIAEDFKELLLSNQPQDINENWTIYIFSGVNRDGVYLGSSHNGPGRTTLYSTAPSNKGIDVNRCWQTSSTYKRYTSDRNYNGTAACQAYEASALRDFLLSNKSTTGQTVLIDLHGWLDETIGDSELGSYYRSSYGITKHISSYGEGYLINWARQNLGANGVAARSALIELPSVNSQQQADSLNFSQKFYNATLAMLRGII